jgi:hypothetical protein
MRASEKRTLLCPLLGSLTWAFRAHKRPEGKRGNGRWPDTRDGDRTREIFFRCAGPNPAARGESPLSGEHAVSTSSEDRGQVKSEGSGKASLKRCDREELPRRTRSKDTEHSQEDFQRTRIECPLLRQRTRTMWALCSMPGVW